MNDVTNKPSGFAVPDILALVFAGVVLIGFVFLPWVESPGDELTGEVPEDPEVIEGEAQPEPVDEAAESEASDEIDGAISGETGEEGRARPEASQGKASDEPVRSNYFRFLIPIASVVGVLAAGWALTSARSRRLALALVLGSGVLVLFYYVAFVFNNIENLSNGFDAARAGFWLTLIGGVGLVAQWFLPRQYADESLPLGDLIPVWRKMTPMMRNEAMTFYLWISPWLIGFLIWQAWPVIESFYLAFTDFRLLNTPEFTGLANLEKLVNDDAFWKSLRVTVLYVVGAVPIGNIIALFVAMVLSQKLRGVNWWRTIYYLPSVVSQVAIAVMWSFVFNPDFGLLNSILDTVGIDGPGWIASEDWALPAITIIAWWSTIGPAMIIYLAGLKGIPGVYYEAAEIDGATVWHQFRHITLPLLSPTIFFNVIVNIIGAFQAFDVPFVLTEGGPNRATTTYIYNLYEEGFIFTNMGYASLLAWVLFIIIVIFTLITIRISSSRVYYEAAVE